tara:strand:+ start:1291 stop:1914 length:624 start_codon:yes stop_codon:yes gene_type:complete
MDIIEKYTNLLLKLFPPGFAWAREKGALIAKLCEALAGVFSRMHIRSEQLIDENDPRTTLEMLPDHEKEWGLPDACVFGEQTLQERRITLINKILMLGGQSRAYFEGIAENLGYDVKLKEYRPIQCGLTPMNIPDASDDIHYSICTPFERFYWEVEVSGPRLTWFRCGESELGIEPHLTIRAAQDLECILARTKPAHTHLSTIYNEA